MRSHVIDVSTRYVYAVVAMSAGVGIEEAQRHAQRTAPRLSSTQQRAVESAARLRASS